MIDEDEPEDDGYCPTCAGTGEGQYDGALCTDCAGKGFCKSVNNDDFNEPDEDWGTT